LYADSIDYEGIAATWFAGGRIVVVVRPRLVAVQNRRLDDRVDDGGPFGPGVGAGEEPVAYP